MQKKQFRPQVSRFEIIFFLLIYAYLIFRSMSLNRNTLGSCVCVYILCTGSHKKGEAREKATMKGGKAAIKCMNNHERDGISAQVQVCRY
jgi:hypothetical protein